MCASLEECLLSPIPETLVPGVVNLSGVHWRDGAAAAGVALGGSSIPAPRSTEAQAPRGWCDSGLLFGLDALWPAVGLAIDRLHEVLMRKGERAMILPGCILHGSKLRLLRGEGFSSVLRCLVWSEAACMLLSVCLHGFGLSVPAWLASDHFSSNLYILAPWSIVTASAASHACAFHCARWSRLLPMGAFPCAHKSSRNCWMTTSASWSKCTRERLHAV